MVSREPVVGATCSVTPAAYILLSPWQRGEWLGAPAAMVSLATLRRSHLQPHDWPVPTAPPLLHSYLRGEKEGGPGHPPTAL